MFLVYNLAHATGWEPFNLHVAHIPWVGSAIQYTGPAQHLMSADLDYLDRALTHECSVIHQVLRFSTENREGCVYSLACMAVVVWPMTLASLQYRDRAHRVFTD